MQSTHTQTTRAHSGAEDSSFHESNCVSFPGRPLPIPGQPVTPIISPMPDNTETNAVDFLTTLRDMIETTDQLPEFLEEQLARSDENRHKWLRVLFIHLVLYTENARLPETERSLITTLETLIAEAGA